MNHNVETISDVIIENVDNNRRDVCFEWCTIIIIILLILSVSVLFIGLYVHMIRHLKC